MNQQEHEEIAELLLEVYASLAGRAADREVRRSDRRDAYEIQLLQVRRWLEGGAQIKGTRSA